MREGISYTVTLNFVMTFVVIIFALLSATLIYFKSNKSSNVVLNGIEKYEGYNALAEDYIIKNLTALGYNMSKISCPNSITAKRNTNSVCQLFVNRRKFKYSRGEKGYCVYFCGEGSYYYYKVRTNLRFNIPLVREIFNFPIYADSIRLYDFENRL